MSSSSSKSVGVGKGVNRYMRLKSHHHYHRSYSGSPGASSRLLRRSFRSLAAPTERHGGAEELPGRSVEAPGGPWDTRRVLGSPRGAPPKLIRKRFRHDKLPHSPQLINYRSALSALQSPQGDDLSALSTLQSFQKPRRRLPSHDRSALSTFQSLQKPRQRLPSHDLSALSTF